MSAAIEFPRMRSLSKWQQKAIWHGLILAGVLFNLNLLLFWLPRLDLWIDAKAWWQLNLADIYATSDAAQRQVGAFRYSPAIAWLFAPATLVSWPVLIASYLMINLAAAALLVRRKALLFVVAFPPVLLELLNGNISIFLGLAIWAGFRWPATWAFVLLSKVTIGVGLLWFVARREWRNLAIALGTTLGIVIVGLAVAPDAWFRWFETLAAAAALPAPVGVPGLVFRVPVAAVITWWAARTDRAWVVPIACWLAQPILWLHGAAMLLACFPLYWDRSRFEAAE